jgi:hypothetical protein
MAKNNERKKNNNVKSNENSSAIGIIAGGN